MIKFESSFEKYNEDKIKYLKPAYYIKTLRKLSRNEDWLVRCRVKAKCLLVGPGPVGEYDPWGSF